jgi:hypothetical protein
MTVAMTGLTALRETGMAFEIGWRIMVINAKTARTDILHVYQKDLIGCPRRNTGQVR